MYDCQDPTYFRTPDFAENVYYGERVVVGTLNCLKRRKPLTIERKFESLYQKRDDP